MPGYFPILSRLTRRLCEASIPAVRTGVLCLVVLCVAQAADPTAAVFDAEAERISFDWRSDMLALHNEVRARFGLRPMSWSPVLAEESRQWAEELLRSGEFRHDGDHRHGQNLFAITGGRATVAFVFNAWASEQPFYSYAANACTDMCGHYTQIVWRDTLNLGCAVLRDSRREVWVCDYSPTGNIVGERPY